MSRKIVANASKWGTALATAARSLGWTAMTQENLDMLPPAGYLVFVRPDQKDPRPAVEWGLRAIREGFHSVQNASDLLAYEDRAYQSILLGNSMPETVLVRSKDMARIVLEDARLGWPIVSKAPFGSSSKTVRALRSRPEAEAELELILSKDGLRKPGWYKTQRHEAIWQRFIPGNDGIIRVCKITPRYGFAFNVLNRPGDWRASGSGRCVPIDPQRIREYDVDRLHSCVEASRWIFNRMQSNWCGLDMMRDPRTARWVTVDVTLAWVLSSDMPGSAWDAPIFDLETLRPHPKGYKGRDQWAVLLEHLAGDQA